MHNQPEKPPEAQPEPQNGWKEVSSAEHRAAIHDILNFTAKRDEGIVSDEEIRAVKASLV